MMSFTPVRATPLFVRTLGAIGRLEMSAVHRTTTIRAAPEALWAFLAEGDNWARWEPDIVEVLSSDGGLSEGGTLRVRLKPRFTATITFTEVAPTRRLVCNTTVANGMMTARAVLELAGVEGNAATNVSYTLSMGGPVGWVIRTLTPGKVIKEAETGLDNLARLACEPQT